MKRLNMAKIAVITCIAAMPAFAGIAMADNDGSAGEHVCAQLNLLGKLEKELGLSDAQKARARAIIDGNRDVVQPIIASLQAEKKYLNGLMRANTVDEAAIRAETFSVAGIQADLNVNRAKTMSRIRAILTTKQSETMDALLLKWDSEERTDPCSP